MCVRPTALASSERGFVLVAVLWILMALSALTVIFSLYLSNSAQALAVNDSSLQVEALVSAGVELTAHRLLTADEKERPGRGEFHFGLNGADAVVSFSSETARIDLNYASKDTLAGLFATLGANENAAKEYADRIVGWRTLPTPGSTNDETALYSAAGLTYSPRQALFVHVNELGLVLGIPPALVERALPFVTIFNGSPSVDVKIASPEVVAAQLGNSSTSLNNAASNASSLAAGPNDNAPNDSAGTPNPGAPSPTGASSPKSGAFRASVQVKLRDGRRLTSEVVFVLGARVFLIGCCLGKMRSRRGSINEGGQGRNDSYFRHQGVIRRLDCGRCTCCRHRCGAIRSGTTRDDRGRHGRDVHDQGAANQKGNLATGRQIGCHWWTAYPSALGGLAKCNSRRPP